MQSCRQCSEALVPGFLFCSFCGAEAARRCATCTALVDARASTCPSCGSQITRATVPKVNSGTRDPLLSRLRLALADEFTVVREIGRGGQAQVYLARDNALKRFVAVKVLTTFSAATNEAIDRFQREARIVAAFQHAHIVKLFRIRQVSGLHLLIMQFLGGRPLSELLAADGALPLPVTMTILHQVGRALEYAHARRVVHRDIKPENVLFDGEGNAVVTDFGIAKLMQQGPLTRDTIVLGTPTYMSPEQCHGEPVSPASDQYALGIMTFEMLTGQPPFLGSDISVMQAHVEGPVPSLRARWPECPPSVDLAIRRMLAKEPADRFASIAEAMDAMGAHEAVDTESRREELRQWVLAKERSTGRTVTPPLGVLPVPAAEPGSPASSASSDSILAGEPSSPGVSSVHLGSPTPNEVRPNKWRGVGIGACATIMVAFIALAADVMGPRRAKVIKGNPGETSKTDTPKTVRKGEPWPQQDGSPSDSYIVRRIVGLPRNLPYDLAPGSEREVPLPEAIAVDSAGKSVAGARVAFSVVDARIARIGSGGRLILADTGTTLIVASAGTVRRQIELTVLPAEPSAPETADVNTEARSAMRQVETWLREGNVNRLLDHLDLTSHGSGRALLEPHVRGSTPLSSTCFFTDANDEHPTFSCTLEFSGKGPETINFEFTRVPTAGDRWSIQVISVI